jgi:adenine-specific DNA-methyltransferase
MLKPGGEIVAITLACFATAPIFGLFENVDATDALRRFHVFQSRKEAFKRGFRLTGECGLSGGIWASNPRELTISISEGDDFSNIETRTIPFEKVVIPDDPDAFIHLAENDEALVTMDRMSAFRTSLEELGLEVSTGRVVDFRARSFLSERPEPGTVPLLYPCHFLRGSVRWPIENSRKPNAIVLTETTQDLLVASGVYVLTKRFSSKEERRRVVAAVFDPKRISSEWIGFENHLNYFHCHGKGLLLNLARGLSVFLNSTLLDRFFRIFSGHTQVNALDLRRMRYPTKEQLLRMGKRISEELPDQSVVDEILKQECGLAE